MSLKKSKKSKKSSHKSKKAKKDKDKKNNHRHDNKDDIVDGKHDRHKRSRSRSRSESKREQRDVDTSKKLKLEKPLKDDRRHSKDKETKKKDDRHHSETNLDDQPKTNHTKSSHHHHHHHDNRSQHRERIKIDKSKLLQIAKANVLKTAAAELESHTVKPDIVEIQKTMNLNLKTKSIDQLVEYCKKLSKQNNDNESDSRDANSPFEADNNLHHPFEIKETTTLTVNSTSCTAHVCYCLANINQLHFE
jgi:hypothetical protein